MTNGNLTPMEAAALKCTHRMAALKFFPKEPEAQYAIAEIVLELASEPEQATWLAKRMLTLFNEWPGPGEMRAVFCSKFRPVDGCEVYSTTYPDGVPSEQEQRPALPAPNPRARITSADNEMALAIVLLAKKKNGNGGGGA